MKTFEECLEVEEYMDKSKTYEAKKRRIKRTLTRMERDRSRSKTILTLSIIGWSVIIVILLAYTVAQCAAVDEDTTQSQVSAEPTSAASVEDVEEWVPEDFENEKIEEALLDRSNKIENCTISHYCTELRPHICGTGNGITASGRRVQAGVSCAVDPDVIPLGSTVMVDYGDGEIHYYVADDVGAWVEGNHIDLAVSGHQEALDLGMKTATVYWCEE